MLTLVRSKHFFFERENQLYSKSIIISKSKHNIVKNKNSIGFRFYVLSKSECVVDNSSIYLNKMAKDLFNKENDDIDAIYTT